MIGFIVFFLTFLLVSCATPETSHNTIKIAVAGEPISLDPYDPLDGYSLQVRAQIFNTLIERNTNGEFVGVLAKSWKYITPTHLRFYLRDDVYFHNGEKFSPKDVKYTIERQQHSIPNKELFSYIKRIDIGTNTVDFHLSKTFIPLLAHLSLPNAYIVNQRAIQEELSQEHPIGTGAYRFQNWMRGHSIKLTANTNYFLGTPSISTLEFKIIPEESSRTIALENNEVDIVRDISFFEADILSERSNLQIFEFMTPMVTYLSVNTKNGIMTNKQIRKAISLALDRQGMINSIFYGKATIADSLIPATAFGYTNIGIHQDIQQAKSIIQKQNIDDTSLIMYTLNGKHLQLAEIIQANLKEIGLDIEIQTLELGTFLQYITQGKQHLYLLNWTTLTSDGDFALTQLLSQNSPWNNTGYNNPTIEQKLELARFQNDSHQRLKLYTEIQIILNNDLPYIPMLSIATVNGASSRIQNIQPINGASALNLQQLSLK